MPFEDLDAIPWNELRCGLGDGGDVPTLLRQLKAGDPSAAMALQDRLVDFWNSSGPRQNIGVFEAAHHAVPFLIELLHEPDVHSPVAHLLLLIAEGQSPTLLEQSVFTSDVTPPRSRESEAALIEEETRHVELARAALAAGVSVYSELLQDEECDHDALVLLLASSDATEMFAARMWETEWPELRLTMALELIKRTLMCAQATLRGAMVRPMTLGASAVAGVARVSSHRGSKQVRRARANIRHLYGSAPCAALLALYESNEPEDRYAAGILDIALNDGPVSEETIARLLAWSDAFGSVPGLDGRPLEYALQFLDGRPEALARLLDECNKTSRLDGLGLMLHIASRTRDAHWLLPRVADALASDRPGVRYAGVSIQACFGSAAPLPDGFENLRSELEAEWARREVLRLLVIHQRPEALEHLRNQLTAACKGEVLAFELGVEFARVGAWADELFVPLQSTIDQIAQRDPSPRPEITEEAPATELVMSAWLGTLAVIPALESSLQSHDLLPPLLMVAVRLPSIQNHLSWLLSLHARAPGVVASALAERRAWLSPLPRGGAVALDALRASPHKRVRHLALLADPRVSDEEREHAYLPDVINAAERPSDARFALELLAELSTISPEAHEHVAPLLQVSDPWLRAFSAIVIARTSAVTPAVAEAFTSVLAPNPLGLLIAKELPRHPAGALEGCRDRLEQLSEGPFFDCAHELGLADQEADAFWLRACRDALAHLSS